MCTKKRFFLSLFAVLMMAAGWTYYKVSAPWFYNTDGTSEWSQSMPVIRQNGILPAYRTQVGFVNRTGNETQNGVVTREAEYATFRLWNGYGVKNLHVLSTNAGNLLFSGPPGSPDIGDLSFIIALATEQDIGPFFSQTDTYGGRHYILTVPVPLNETEITVFVVDKFGNVTSTVLNIPPEN